MMKPIIGTGLSQLSSIIRIEAEAGRGDMQNNQIMERHGTNLKGEVEREEGRIVRSKIRMKRI